ncbi:E3 ubiquitin-protein ligase BRE1-like 1 [Asparagus officinalis]|uniref:E3 ubiquitin-protein ligase BRE1-like 1 n=1 Tax=Asparagus officinalis TaxID=4686 RepID=UPI00098E1ACC|nr:E3 ubiquitin-protein ligase BRE1-like 1 [Asparagus officinalis]
MLEDAADGAPSFPVEEDFMSRLMETGATESCCDVLSPRQLEADVRTSQLASRNILQNIMTSVNRLWHVNNKAVSALCMTLSGDESNRQLQKAANDLQMEVQSSQVAIQDLHLKHRPLANKVQYQRDMDAKNRAEHKRLAGELASAVAELGEINCRLASLKAQKDAAPGTPFLFPTIGNKQVDVDKLRDKQKEFQELEATLKNLKDVASSRLAEIRSLHERRIEVLKSLGELQNDVKNVQSITSSKAFLLLSEQLDKSKAEMDECRTSFEKLQVEKDSFTWHEKELALRADLVDVCRGFSAFSESHISELEQEVQKLLEERITLEGNLDQVSKEPGRKEIIAEFKSLVASLPKDMAVMQRELNRYKEASLEIHCLRAEVQSLSNILNRKVRQLESLSGMSAQQISEIKKLEAVVQDLRESDHELKLILDMYRRESIDSREVMEGKEMEYKAWAHVHSLKSSLDEHNLELRVKEANEAEAVSQQRLATTEAEIADLRQNLESSGRDIHISSETLKSKHEEGEAYLSEIESIGQAYEDMQTQNQHLLQQITERDDYNIKLVMEGIKARQQHDVLCSEVYVMDKKIKLANLFLDLFNQKVERIDDQLKIWSDQIGRLVEDIWQKSSSLGDNQRRVTDVEREYQQTAKSLGERQAKAAKSRLDVTELLIELEKERFNKRRLEEECDVMRRKAECLREKIQSSTALGKLKQEVTEYRGILKCRICHDRQKEVVIAKCYHLFCSQCVQRTLESRHRKCPSCGVSFGQNDVKPIYI